MQQNSKPFVGRMVKKNKKNIQSKKFSLFAGYVNHLQATIIAKEMFLSTTHTGCRNNSPRHSSCFEDMNDGKDFSKKEKRMLSCIRY